MCVGGTATKWVRLGWHHLLRQHLHGLGPKVSADNHACNKAGTTYLLSPLVTMMCRHAALQSIPRIIIALLRLVAEGDTFE